MTRCCASTVLRQQEKSERKMTTSCLFLKPEVKTPQDLVKQMQDINRYIKPAIAQNGLAPLDGQIDGLAVSGILDNLIQRIYQADVIIIDANCYETSGTYQFSHYLYYYMAISHLRGNITILVTDAQTHLPPTLVTHHTLTYSAEGIWSFLAQFKAAVEEILQMQGQGEPDNPIQAYRTRTNRDEELAEARQKIARLEAEKEEKTREPQNKSIVFRRVGER